jgi:hypothetical protein
LGYYAAFTWKEILQSQKIESFLVQQFFKNAAEVKGEYG